MANALHVAATDLITPASTAESAHRDKIIELCALGDSLERQISRASQIAERYDYEAHDTSVTAEQRAVAAGQAEETQQIAYDLETELERIDTALDALSVDD
jgi:hypothetical protein